MGDTRKYPLSDVKILYARASGHCSKCKVNVVLEDSNTEKPKQIGKIAHIIAHSPKGPRADTSYPKNKLDTYANWILLCPTCHDTVDALEGTYRVETLTKLKKNHEDWIADNIDNGMSEFTFAELEIAARAIASGQHSDKSDFHVITPEEKIEKNNLTEKSRAFLTMGLSRSTEVEKFLSSMTIGDNTYTNRLKAGFKKKYKELKQTLDGDGLFFEMLNFSQTNQCNFEQKAASLAILSHMFYLCEVFEK